MLSTILQFLITASLCLSQGDQLEQWKRDSPIIEVNSAIDSINEQQEVQWSYEGETGPQHWGELDSSFSACKYGAKQSPINIEFSQVKAKGKFVYLDIRYHKLPYTLINNGHSIQANVKTSSNRIIIGGKEYRLVQFHFHTPSEHTFNRSYYDMELHLVHQAGNGSIAVLGVMIKEGKKNEVLAPAWEIMPKEKTEEEIIMKESINIKELLPTNKILYHYMGSLTTPPCSENIKWFLYQKPIEMSQDQIEQFQNIFPDNHRPIQPLNGREIVPIKSDTKTDINEGK